jgi:hypothetical protein
MTFILWTAVYVDFCLKRLGSLRNQHRTLALPNRRLGPAVKPCHPHLIAPEKMAERAVNGAPEGPAGKTPRLIRKA